MAKGRVEIVLEGGRIVRLRALEQWLVYADLLEGLPTVEMNQKKMDLDRKAAAARWNGSVHLIDPVQEPLEYRRDRPYPFGAPSALPSVGARALFYSLTPTEPSHSRGRTSDLIVVWYQADWAMPIEDPILDQLAGVEWAALARDREA